MGTAQHRNLSVTSPEIVGIRVKHSFREMVCCRCDSLQEGLVICFINNNQIPKRPDMTPPLRDRPSLRECHTVLFYNAYLKAADNICNCVIGIQLVFAGLDCGTIYPIGNAHVDDKRSD